MDYIFITAEGFMELEKSGALLESGTYEGKHALDGESVTILFPPHLMKLHWDFPLQRCHYYCYQKCTKCHVAIMKILSYVKAKCRWVHCNFSVLYWVEETG